MQRLHATPKQFKLSHFNFAIPLMSLAGLATLGIFAINQDVDYNASASNTTDINSTLSYGDQYITISNSSTIDLSSDQLSADATYIYATDNVTVSTNVPTGYELYLTSSNKESSALTTTGSSDKVSATSGTGGELGTPKVLDDNSYGYAVPSGLINNTNFNSDYTSPTSSSKWAGIPAGTSDRIRTSSTAVTSGETTDVHYGANVNNALAPGQYKGSVIYSAVVTPTTGTYEISVSPSVGISAGGTTLTITSGPTTINTAANLDTSEVEVYFRQSGVTKGTCNVTNVDASSGHLVTTCTTPILSSGNYDIMVSVPRYSFKDIKNNSLTIPLTLKDAASIAGITALQGLTNSVCSEASIWAGTGEDFTLKDSRDNRAYTVRKLADNHCWMVQNLNLQGGTKITKDDSDITNASYSLPTSSNSNFNNAFEVHVYNDNNINTGYYSWPAATAGAGSDGAFTSGNSAISICPKGWKLPKGDTSDYSWYHLYNTGYNSNADVFQTTTNTTSDYFYGYYEGNNNNDLGTTGIWVSRTSHSFGNVYALSISNTDLSPQSTPLKANGLNIRCVLTSE